MPDLSQLIALFTEGGPKSYVAWVAAFMVLYPTFKPFIDKVPVVGPIASKVYDFLKSLPAPKPVEKPAAPAPDTVVDEASAAIKASLELDAIACKRGCCGEERLKRLIESLQFASAKHATVTSFPHPAVQQVVAPEKSA